MAFTCQHIVLFLFCIQAHKFGVEAQVNKPKGMHRPVCAQRVGKVIQPVSVYKDRLAEMRDQMLIRSSVQGPEIDAYILPSYDEHLNDEVAEHDRRLHYLTGFTGSKAFGVVTPNGAGLWVDERFFQQADGELDCNWEVYALGGNVSIADWLESELHSDMRIGADPHLVPHTLWLIWQAELKDKFLNLVKVNTNLVDLIWGVDRPPVKNVTIKVQELRFAGEKWQSKISTVRDTLKSLNCNAIVISSLTEIAYLLNIRGREIPYIPVVKGYLVVSRDEVIFYTDRAKVTLGILLHLNADPCYSSMCVTIKEYNHIWSDLRTYAQLWKRVLMPAPCVYDKGTSEAVYTAVPEKIVITRISPVIFMKAQKNDVERNGMRTAHILDGAAMCEAMSNLEHRFSLEPWTELKIKYEVELSRLSQPHSKGLSLGTIVAFGEHSAIPYYVNSNITDIEVTDGSTLVIESGGQYFDGTTDVSRTFHFGQPTAEQKRAYTNVLSGILRLSHLKFPANLHPAEIDALSRSPVWDAMSDYPHATGHGIGSYMSVQEPPIDVSYTTSDKFNFKEGYFFSNEPGYYKRGSFGIRLENVLEVVDTGRIHPSGSKFLAFSETTLVPYEPKFIDGAVLSAQEKRWLNDYNAKIRDLVGDELKRQGNMRAFYWMMNKTRHIREYLPEDEYRASSQSWMAANPLTAFSLLAMVCQITGFLL